MRQLPQSSSFLPRNLFWGLVIGLTVFRLVMIAISPLELGVDEAQYWLWGQELAFGYYSKPPLIGWWLGLTDALFGSSAAATRIGAPALHLLIAMLVYHTSLELYDRLAAQFAALLWISLPIVGLGSFVISTDSLMLMFWSAGLYCIARSRNADANDSLKWFGLAGLMIGFAMLAKYAAIYFAIGIAGMLVQNCKHHSVRIIFYQLAWFIVGMLAGAAPTLIWNLLNGFVTVLHLGQNANLEVPLYSVQNLFSFIAAQFAVIGPVLAMLLLGAFMRISPADKMRNKTGFLIWFILPPLCIISVQAFIKEANANWAVAAYPAAMVLSAILLSQRCASPRWKFASISALSTNFIITLIIGGCLGLGSLGIFTPESDPLRRLRGWSVLAEDVAQIAHDKGAYAILAPSRASAAALSWQLADTRFIVVVPAPTGAPSNHYQRSKPLNDTTPRPILALTDIGKPPEQLAGWQGPVGSSSTQISRNRKREFQFWFLP